MLPKDVKKMLGNLPYMRLEQGERIYDFIRDNRLWQCLELGFYHGVSSAYIGGALQENHRGSLITIDLDWARTLQPNIVRVIADCGLQEFVTYYFERTSYNWRLMQLLRDRPDQQFDFCYIDGGHTWYSTGFAFCLVSRLLKPGGWIIFDDLDWTHEDPEVREAAHVRAMPDEERRTPQIRMVYELLVMRDSAFDDCFIEGQWAFAHKRH